ncbi:type IV secretion system DNA-binding domain-containing protein [Escherichia coli]|uniref:type IV secretion system DNA-binding domain-containing protein n=1 Tax=Escherichia coli TaxID=562 RepID=UPI003C6C2028
MRDSEIQNFCLHGTVGAGKSEVIRRLANYARQRGDMVVIYDRSPVPFSVLPAIRLQSSLPVRLVRKST